MATKVSDDWTVAEWQTEVTDGQAYAEQQAACLIALGLKDNEAWRLINIIGPRRAVRCYVWISELRTSLGEHVLKVRLTRVARQIHRVHTEKLLAKVFWEKRVTLPTGGYVIMIRHLRVAQYLGLVSQKIRLPIK